MILWACWRIDVMPKENTTANRRPRDFQRSLLLQMTYMYAGLQASIFRLSGVPIWYLFVPPASVLLEGSIQTQMHRRVYIHASEISANVLSNGTQMAIHGPRRHRGVPAGRRATPSLVAPIGCSM